MPSSIVSLSNHPPEKAMPPLRNAMRPHEALPWLRPRAAWAWPGSDRLQADFYLPSSFVRALDFLPPRSRAACRRNREAPPKYGMLSETAIPVHRPCANTRLFPVADAPQPSPLPCLKNAQCGRARRITPQHGASTAHSPARRNLGFWPKGRASTTLAGRILPPSAKAAFI